MFLHQLKEPGSIQYVQALVKYLTNEIMAKEQQLQLAKVKYAAK